MPELERARRVLAVGCTMARAAAHRTCRVVRPEEGAGHHGAGEQQHDAQPAAAVLMFEQLGSELITVTAASGGRGWPLGRRLQHGVACFGTACMRRQGKWLGEAGRLPKFWQTSGGAGLSGTWR